MNDQNVGKDVCHCKSKRLHHIVLFILFGLYVNLFVANPAFLSLVQ